jgi:hypothetical protein
LQALEQRLKHRCDEAGTDLGQVIVIGLKRVTIMLDTAKPCVITLFRQKK